MDKLEKPTGKVILIGSAMAIASLVPLTGLQATQQRGPERLGSLRAAAAAGQLELLTIDKDGRLQSDARTRLADGGSFDRSGEAPFDKGT